jgi:hypothetical protein
MRNSMISLKSSLLIGGLVISSMTIAGNEDRVGTSGAGQLLVNPWSRSASMGSAGIASATGLEASFLNIAGLAFTDKTQIKFNSSNWMGNANIKFYSAGLAQRISEQSVFAFSVQSMNMGELLITTVANPEGGFGTFSPRLNVVNLGYARTFSSSIYAGINLKVISEKVQNAGATGVALDAGIKYVTGEQDQFKFGITLKNVGPTMRMSGDGFGQQVTYNSIGEVATLEQRTADYELPSNLGIGASYDFIFDDKNMLVAAFGYTANSFFYDQFRLGLDYGMRTEKVAFNLRGGYVYEKNLLSAENSANALVGPTAGFSVDALTGASKNALGIEYCARFAGKFGIIHTFGLTISLK